MCGDLLTESVESVTTTLYYVDSIVIEEPKLHRQTMIFKLLPELSN